MALTLFSNDLYKTHWICKVKSILDNCGLSYMWENQCTLDNSTCKNIIFRRIDDIALNRWYTDLSVSFLCTFYRQFKPKLCFDKYVLMPNSRERISLTKYRCTNYQYISTFTCMTLIYVRCATLIAKVMNTIIF